MVGARGEERSRAARTLARSLSRAEPDVASFTRLAAGEAASLAARMRQDPTVRVLVELLRARGGAGPLATGLRASASAWSFEALFLHFAALTHVVAVPVTGAIAVVGGIEVYRVRGDDAILHRSASMQLRDARCHECFLRTELAVIWSLRAIRDAAAVPIAAALAISAARHCVPAP